MGHGRNTARGRAWRMREASYTYVLSLEMRYRHVRIYDLNPVVVEMMIGAIGCLDGQAFDPSQWLDSPRFEKLRTLPQAPHG